MSWWKLRLGWWIGSTTGKINIYLLFVPLMEKCFGFSPAIYIGQARLHPVSGILYPFTIYHPVFYSLTLKPPKPASGMYHKSKRKVHILLHPELGDTKRDKIINGFIIILENMGKQKINKTLKKNKYGFQYL